LSCCFVAININSSNIHSFQGNLIFLQVVRLVKDLQGKKIYLNFIEKKQK